jgi:hypothetical protein
MFFQIYMHHKLFLFHSELFFNHRQCHFNGVAMHLFRLLLLYHEPELCSFLDSHKIAPNLYTQKWVNNPPLFISNIFD